MISTVREGKQDHEHNVLIPTGLWLCGISTSNLSADQEMVQEAHSPQWEGEEQFVVFIARWKAE